MTVFTTRKALLAAALLATTSTSAMAQSSTVYGGGSTLAAAVYNGQFNAYSSANPNALFNYAPTGSGAAQTSFLNNDPVTSFGYPAGTTVDYAASDATLSAAQIASFPTASNGNLVQIPSFGTPITIPFNLAGKTSNGALALSDAEVCGIFSGRLTDWSQVGGSGVSGTIYAVYRGDGSGTSFLLTQHLAAVCNSSNSNVTFAASTSFASNFPGGVPATLHAATGSPGVAAAINGNALAVGYLTPDLTRISPNRAGSATAPYVASVNGVLPTSLNVANALSTAPAPSGSAQINDPAAYVPAIAAPSSGYPIVGFTTLEFSQCYKDAGVANTIADFINNLYTSVPYENLITSNGFSVVPSTFSNVILNNIYNNNSGYNADIQNATVCTGGKGR